MAKKTSAFKKIKEAVKKDIALKEGELENKGEIEEDVAPVEEEIIPPATWYIHLSAFFAGIGFLLWILCYILSAHPLLTNAMVILFVIPFMVLGIGTLIHSATYKRWAYFVVALFIVGLVTAPIYYLVYIRDPKKGETAIQTIRKLLRRQKL